jgi:hypothetical protein
MTLGAWPEGVPLSVSSYPRFCTLGPRCGKWSPEATIKSTNYNWMLMEGSFSTWEDCATTYQRHYEPKDHDDGVCFRSAVFSQILSYWCRRFKLKINMNVHDHVQPIFIIMLKIQYHNARWKRIVETMAITRFIA